MKRSNRTIAVLSGKGGTGKTLVSVNLAAAAESAVYIDCDVEEPNGHLFFKPEITSEETVSVKIPVIDLKRCDGCRKCVDFCRFNALAFLKNEPVLFRDICHSCGGCVLFCPRKAIGEEEKDIGVIQSGVSGRVRVHTGRINAGEASGVPVIKRLLQKGEEEQTRTVFIDCPPGSACSVMESIRNADYCVLVAEPTVFGAHNLKMVCDLAETFHKPYGVVLNKCLELENPSEKFCMENRIPILGRIPFDSNLGSLNSNARIAARENDCYREMFSALLDTVVEEAKHETAADPQR
ncbi:MAG: ATP-binding protein [Eubacteriales bacterium]|nr:ATP-binding protein [Eubacteriales bacterium]